MPCLPGRAPRTPVSRFERRIVVAVFAPTLVTCLMLYIVTRWRQETLSARLRLRQTTRLA